MSKFIVTFYVFSLFCQRRSSCWKYRKWCSYFENPYQYARVVDKNRMTFLVNPYCTLLFPRKENFKFFKVALVSVHCNYLIVCTVIARDYQRWNTANATADISLLVKNSNKNTDIKCKVVQTFFISRLAALRPTLGHWEGGSIFKFEPKATKSLVMRSGPKVGLSASWEFEPKTFWFWE